MHVLVLPSFYHTLDRPHAGTFFRDWAWALRRTGVKVGVAYAEARSLRRIGVRTLRETHFQVSVGEEDALPMVRLRAWNPFAQTSVGGLVWAGLSQRAIDAYLSHFGRPDLFAAQGALWAGEAARRAGRRLGVPYSVTEINTRFGTGDVKGWDARLSRRIFEGASAVVAISWNLQRRLAELSQSCRVEVVPCTVDDGYWTMPPGGRGAQGFTFYAQAHLVPRKGFDLLIRAFAASFKNEQGVRLVIGGDGRIRGALEALATSLEVAPQVCFLGALARDEVRRAMWEADCFVLPSLAENFGVVLIESLATGLPVIATRCGGPEDIVNAGVGILIEPGDEQALARAMIEARRGLGLDPERLRAYAASRYGYASVGGQLRDVYQRALSAS